MWQSYKLNPSFRHLDVHSCQVTFLQVFLDWHYWLGKSHEASRCRQHSHGHKEARRETGCAVGASHSVFPNQDTHHSTQSPHRVPQPQNKEKYQHLLPLPSSLGLWASSRSHLRKDCEEYAIADFIIKQAILFFLALQTIKKIVALLIVVLIHCYSRAKYLFNLKSRLLK